MCLQNTCTHCLLLVVFWLGVVSVFPLVAQTSCRLHQLCLLLHRSLEQSSVLFSLCFPDVYSFQEEGPVSDPHLAKHLAHFGIDMLHTQGVRKIFCFHFYTVVVMGRGSLICLIWNSTNVHLYFIDFVLNVALLCRIELISILY